MNETKVNAVKGNQKLGSVKGDIESIEVENIDEYEFQMEATKDEIKRTRKNLKEVEMEIEEKTENIRRNIKGLVEQIYSRKGN